MTHARVTLDRPWLAFDLAQPCRVLSWTLNRPGFVSAERIIWREVRNADLPKDFAVHGWFLRELAQRGEAESVAFLTSRNIEKFHVAEASVGAVTATALATVGLSNAERIGTRGAGHPLSHGTINVAVELNSALSEMGLIEALSIAVQARTTAVLEAQITLPTGIATGTGTDCVAVAVPPGAEDYAGLHTEVGEALGRAVYDAVGRGATEWKEEMGKNR